MTSVTFHIAPITREYIAQLNSSLVHVGLLGNLCWKGLQEASSPTPCSEYGQLQGQTRLLQTVTKV